MEQGPLDNGSRPAASDSATVGGTSRALAALDHADDLVQLLATAKYALSMGDTPRAMTAIDEALTTSKRTLTELLTMTIPTQASTYAGTLVRGSAQLVEPTGVTSSDLA